MQSHNCIQCGDQMRPRQARAKDHPGLVTHHGGGKCANCYMTEYRERKRQAEAQEHQTAAAVTDPLDNGILQRMEHVSRGTADFIRARRGDRIPAKGTSKVAIAGRTRSVQRV